MTISRRQFVKSAITFGTGIACSAFACNAALGKPAKKQAEDFLISAQGNNASNFNAVLASVETPYSDQLVKLPATGFRGHGLAQNPVLTHKVAMFARRPGKHLIVFNLVTGDIEKSITLGKNRVSMGHGVFSHDGQYLYTVEADAQSGEGIISVRGANSLNLHKEVRTHGIGPHEIKLLPYGICPANTAVVANGGILTRPQTGRLKLNLDSMDSSLVYIDLDLGELVEQHRVDEPKCSIRHLDVSDDGSVIFAMQMQRDAASHNELVPLVGIHKRHDQIRLLDQQGIITPRLNDYVGSVAVSNMHSVVGVTSPHGNLAVFWKIDRNNSEIAGYHRFNDVCGIAVSPDQSAFLLSNSMGEIRRIDASNLKQQVAAKRRHDNILWDNHMITVRL